jgi:hypothetical protein
MAAQSLVVGTATHSIGRHSFGHASTTASRERLIKESERRQSGIDSVAHDFTRWAAVIARGGAHATFEWLRTTKPRGFLSP